MQLEELGIYSRSCTKEGTKKIQTILTILHLNCRKIGDDWFEILKEFSLTKLSLCSNNITKKGLSILTDFKKLQTFELINSNITNQDIKCVGSPVKYLEFNARRNLEIFGNLYYENYIAIFCKKR